AAYQLVGTALEHFDNHALELAAILAFDLAKHAVAMQHLEHFARRQEQVWPAVVSEQETEAVAVALDTASDEFEFGVDLDLALAVHKNLAVSLHGLETAFKPDRQWCLGAARPSQGLLRHGFSEGTQLLHDDFATGHFRIEIRGKIDRSGDRFGRTVIFGSFAQRGISVSSKTALYCAPSFEKAAKLLFGKSIAYTLSPGGGIGRRAWFRSMCRKVWRFESSPGHHWHNSQK